MAVERAKVGRNGSEHPFARKEPKPTRARLVSLLDPLGRKRYGEVERFLATVHGATSGLHYYDTTWGWAVRYMLGSKDALCTLHLTPNSFEATVPLDKASDWLGNGAVFTTELRRRISRTPPRSGTRWVRLPIRSDGDYGNFQSLIHAKAEAVRSKEGKSKTASQKAVLGVAKGA